MNKRIDLTIDADLVALQLQLPERDSKSNESN